MERFSRISGALLNNFLGDIDCNKARNNVFTANIEECVELLELLGMPVLRAKHEAEGLCAELERQGFVDACVTPDSDAFLYGAKTVIKVLHADLKDPHIESYLMSDIETLLGLHREHLVALALLAGCDYNVHGVSGIGCHNAVRLIKSVPKHQIFDSLRDWGKGSYDPLPGGRCLDVHEAHNRRPATEKTTYHCSTCGHPGTKPLHKELGCELCNVDDGISILMRGQACRPKVQGFKCTCVYCKKKETTRKLQKQDNWKLKVCKKISETRGFPNEEIIQIFMNPEHDTLGGDGSSKPPLAWKHLQLKALERFLGEHLHWDNVYIRQKVLPLLSFYCLRDIAASRTLGTSNTVLSTINGLYIPHSIQRIKVLFSKPLYRLRWKQMAGIESGDDWLGLKYLSSENEKKTTCNDIDMITSDLQIEKLESSLMFTTDEDMLLVKEACPNLVSRFEQEQDAHRNMRKGNSRRKKVVDLPPKEHARITSFFKLRKNDVIDHTKSTSTLSDNTGSCFPDCDVSHKWYGEGHLEESRSEINCSRVSYQRPSCKEQKGAQGDGAEGTMQSNNSKILNFNEDASIRHCEKLTKLTEVMDLEDEERNSSLSYPCKVKRIGDASPGLQTYRELMRWSPKRVTSQSKSASTPPPDTSDNGLVSHMFSEPGSVRRILF